MPSAIYTGYPGTGNSVFTEAPSIALTISVPNGGQARLSLTVAEYERFKRGAHMIAGGWRSAAAPEELAGLSPEQREQQLAQFERNREAWDRLSERERRQIETDADWLCHKLEVAKIALADRLQWSRLSSGNGSRQRIGRSSPPST